MTDISRFATAKSCTEVWKLLGYETTRFCCDSCHEDAERGYDDLAELDLPDGGIGLVCCSVLKEWKEDPHLAQQPERSKP